MKAIITHINQRRGMAAAKTNDGTYSIIEFSGNDEIEIGDQIEWSDDTELGEVSLNNYTQNTRIQVYFLNHQVHQSMLKSQLLL